MCFSLRVCSPLTAPTVKIRVLSRASTQLPAADRQTARQPEGMDLQKKDNSLPNTQKSKYEGRLTNTFVDPLQTSTASIPTLPLFCALVVSFENFLFGQVLSLHYHWLLTPGIIFSALNKIKKYKVTIFHFTAFTSVNFLFFSLYNL